MTDKIKLLEDKVGQVLGRLDELQGENVSLKEQNTGLKSELVELQQTFKQFKLENNDRAEQVKSKLATLLARIEELEQIGL
ncbi:MAG: cell division protein ZapB [candidate division Zixibacteria bacterium]|nr:cell division protein ZapB [candidate division Zixibacteria bacterium]